MAELEFSISKMYSECAQQFPGGSVLESRFMEFLKSGNIEFKPPTP